MRVALINADQDLWALGARTLSAVLKEAGHATRLLLLSTERRRLSAEALEAVREHVADCDLIGVSSVSRGSDKAKQVLEHLRPLGKPTIWGGVHATMDPQECSEYADLVCLGEGEGLIVELADRLGRGLGGKDLANVAYREDGRLVVNEMRPLVRNLDDLPLPDFDYLDEFHLVRDRLVAVDSLRDVRAPGLITFNGSRGCAFHCTYCGNAKLKSLLSPHGPYVRRLSAAKYVASTAGLKRRFPDAKYFFFADEDFFARSAEDLREFAAAYSQEVGLPFECCGSPLRITEEKMRLLTEAGLWRVRMGIESGSERTKREVYDRPMSNAAVEKAAAVISRFPQVVPYYFVIIGNPYEQEDDLVATVRHLAHLPGRFFLQAFNLVFFPGSLLYDRAVHDGLIAGKSGSGYELDVRAGFRRAGHAWKERNLYLNGLLFLMEGKGTRARLGCIPRSLLTGLLSPGWIRFNDRHPGVIKLTIAVRLMTLRIRTWTARALKWVLGDPTAVYHLSRYLRSRLSGAIWRRPG